MRLSLLLMLCLFCAVQSCKNRLDNTSNTSAITYDYYDVGDILVDKSLDDPDFSLCDSTDVNHNRNSLIYPGGKKQIVTFCTDTYRASDDYEDFTGYIVVRFLINCQGKTGRFRSEILDLEFRVTSCSIALTDHIVSIVKGLDQWDESSNMTPEQDYSKYINFKIVKGELESVHL